MSCTHVLSLIPTLVYSTGRQIFMTVFFSYYTWNKHLGYRNCINSNNSNKFRYNLLRFKDSSALSISHLYTCTTFYSLLNVFMRNVYLLVWMAYHTQHQELFLALSTKFFFLCFLVALYFICKTRLTSGGVSLIKIIPFFPSAWLEINKTEFYFIFARMKNFRLFICSFSYFMAALFTIYHRYSNNSSKFWEWCVDNLNNLGTLICMLLYTTSYEYN